MYLLRESQKQIVVCFKKTRLVVYIGFASMLHLVFFRNTSGRLSLSPRVWAFVLLHTYAQQELP